jgi:hypothetical protein
MRRSVIGAGVGLFMAVSAGALSLPAAGQSPSTSADPGLDAALAAVELMNDVPAGIRETCGPSTAPLDGVVASTTCSLPGPAGVAIYVRFDGEASLQAGYDLIAAASNVAPDTGTSCGAGDFEGEFATADGPPGGRLLCVLAPEGLSAIWTHPDRRILGLVQLLESTDYEVLEDAWQAARIDTASAMASAAPSAPPVVSSTASASASSASPSLVPAASIAPGASLTQWAVSATASSEYGAEGWSAAQATGEPDTPDYGDYATAWAPATSDGGPAWLELAYAQAVIPTEVVIWESSGNGFVTSVEAWDSDSGAWVMLWEGQDGSPQFVVGFSPELTPVDFATDRLRISIDTDVPDWNEVDAVALTGTVAEQP